MIYLDNSATTKPCAEAVEAMHLALTENWANPSALYGFGIDAARNLRVARHQVAAAMGAEPDRIFFTSGGTEADNWAIFGTAKRLGKRGKHIITTAIEHHAILNCMKELESQGFEVTYLQPDGQGRVTLDALKAALRKDTILVSIMMVNNEAGSVMPIAQMAKLTHKLCPNAIFHTDAVQGFGKVPFKAKTLGADLISVSGHKVHGPKGVGALYIAETLRNPKPLLSGGGQESGMRSGTEATAQIAGFAKAVELRMENLDEKLAKMAALKEYCRQKLLTIDTMVTVGEGTAPHILSLSLPGYPSANIVSDLGSQGICISAGSACHKGKSSHVVSALGLSKRTTAGVIRISFGPESSEADVDALYEALREHKEKRFPML